VQQVLGILLADTQAHLCRFYCCTQGLHLVFGLLKQLHAL
jgi:hypothetical protein